MGINDLNIPNSEMWKYVDDTTICEIVAKNQSSSLQSAVDVFGKNTSNDKFQLTCKRKSEELRINFCTKIHIKVYMPRNFL